jgi:outer membrane protein assembly factor BamB
MRTRRSLSVLACGVGFALGLLGCGGDKDLDPPAELVNIKSKLDVKRVWDAGLGGDAERLRLALRPTVASGVVYAASHEGLVRAFTASNGKLQWSVKTKLPLSAGPEVVDGTLIVGSSEGDIIALDAADGKQRWRSSVKSEVLARPLIVNDLVVVRTVDGHVEALALADGAKRWAVDEPVPRLTLRGTAAPVLAGDRIIAAFDSGKVIAIDPRNGEVIWDETVNAPRGRTELQRLADIDAPPRVAGDDVFVVGFQGRVAMLAVDSGQTWWARDASSYRGFTLDDQFLYLTSSDSVVMCMRRTDGAVQWEQSGLRKRAVTAPAIDGDSLVVGDFEGFLHWLDRSTGEIVARAKSGGERVANAATTAEEGVFIQTEDGKLLAFTSKPKAQRTAVAPPAAEAEATPPADVPPTEVAPPAAEAEPTPPADVPPTEAAP